MLNRFLFLLPFVLVICSISPIDIAQINIAQAQGIKIVDCQGRTKALRQQVGSSQNSIKVNVVDTAGQEIQEGQITLVNAKGTLLKAAIVNGTAQFTDISPGVWMISSDSHGLFFTQIGISDFVVPFWETAGASITKVAEVALVVGAAVGATILINDATEGSGGGSDSNDGDHSGTCLTCDPDVSAPSIPDFD